MKHDWLMKIGLGGVQRFIAEARKVQDLRVGSRLVSEIAKAMGEYASKLPDTHLLRPTNCEAQHWPHQIVLRLNQYEESKIREIGAELESQAKMPVRKLLDVSSLKVTMASTLKQMDSFDSVALERELELIGDLFEIYWVAVRVADNLSLASTELFRLYDDRRHTRTFGGGLANNDIEPWICSLCGQRPAFFKPKSGTTWERDHRLLKRREKFCPLCMAKRLQPESSVSSTHSLARNRFFRLKISEPILNGPSEQWGRVLDQWDELYASHGASAEGLEFAAETKSAFERIEPALRQQICDLSPYYAIILYDGDHMGAWFSGERFAKEHVASDDKYFVAQRELSRALLDFANRVHGQAACFDSEVVYAGGDEGLILTPIDFALPWLTFLNNQAQEVSLKSLAFCEPNATGMTFSAYTSFVHAKFPLQPALRSAQAALSEVKEAADRNCVSIQVNPRSGAAGQIDLRWEELDSLERAIELFCNWQASDLSQIEPGTDRMDRPHAPTRLIYKALSVLPGFFSTPRNDLVLREQLKRELLRISDCDKLPWKENWARAVDWLAVRGTVEPRLPHFRGRHALEEALKVVGWLARQLNWGANQT